MAYYKWDTRVLCQNVSKTSETLVISFYIELKILYLLFMKSLIKSFYFIRIFTYTFEHDKPESLN